MWSSAASRADPMLTSTVRLLAFDLLSIQPHPHLTGAFTRKGRAVKVVEMLGVVVSVDRRESYAQFKLDDGTGCVPCILWTNHSTSAYFAHFKDAELEVQAEIATEQANKVKLGSLLRVQGRLTEFRNRLQITVSSLQEEKDPNSEVLHWMQCVQLALRFYDLPFPPAAPSSVRDT